MSLIDTFNVEVCSKDGSGSSSKNISNCPYQKIHQMKKMKNNQFRGFIEIRPLENCQEYLVLLTPWKTLEDHRIMNSGQNLNTKETTLCSIHQGHHNIGAKNPDGLELTIVLFVMVLIGLIMVSVGLKSIWNDGFNEKYCASQSQQSQSQQV